MNRTAPAGAPKRGTALLEVEGLRTRFLTEAGELRAVDGVSFRLGAGETLGLVGESGCGKSVTALSILRLVDEPPGRILAGSSVRLRGEEILAAKPARLRQLRGGEIAMIFQEPMSSLNPVFPVGEQIAEALRRHTELRGRALREEVVRLLARVGIPEPEERRRHYPHQLSGGMRQRAMIAMAVSCRPAVLIADEPTTALDVSIQAQILGLLRSLQEEFGMALLFISHDLGVVSKVASRVAVMYAGQIVEEAPTSELFRSPRHPYTEGLLLAVPEVDRPRDRLAVIPGGVPHPSKWPEGCRFHPRCPYAWRRCVEAPPVARDGAAAVRCWLEEEPARRAGAGYLASAPPPGQGPGPGR
ncbi:MAG: ABC transporter ATP-binding protein [Gemmatimonadota bacterium]